MDQSEGVRVGVGRGQERKGVKMDQRKVLGKVYMVT